jgi:hypothetical protein
MNSSVRGLGKALAEAALGSDICPESIDEFPLKSQYYQGSNIAKTGAWKRGGNQVGSKRSARVSTLL